MSLLGLNCVLDGKEGKIINVTQSGDIYIEFAGSPHIQIVNHKHTTCINGALYFTSNERELVGGVIGCHPDHCAHKCVCSSYK